MPGCGAGSPSLTCLVATLLLTLASFLPLLRMVLALRGERASESAPFLRCRGRSGPANDPSV